MTITALATHTVKIIRYTEPITKDVGDPVMGEETLATNLPCRFDRGHGRTLTGVVKNNRVTGRLFIDAGALGDNGALLSLNEKDVFEISGETGVYTIDSLDRVFARNTFHHYEIDLMDNKSV